MITTKVSNLCSPQTNRPVVSQFELRHATLLLPEDTFTGRCFQSYNTVIAFHAQECGNTGNIDRLFLDKRYWDYSTTTVKYLREFLGVDSVVDVRAMIDRGDAELIDLNGEGHQL